MVWRKLSYAAENGSLSMFKLLVEEHKYSPESGDSSGCTPLTVAARHGRVEIVEYLLKLGTNPSCRGFDNCTPIFSAILGGQIEILSLLIDYGARTDPMMLTVYPICYVLDSNVQEKSMRMKASKFLLEHMEFSELPTDDNEKCVLLCVAAACGAEALVQRLLEHGCHPDATQMVESAPSEISGTTALTWATKFGHETVVRLLLENGANTGRFHAAQSRFA